MIARAVASSAALLLAVACSTQSSPPRLTPSQLLDPTSCQVCHATHYAGWSASMHAYASDDPVFRAMNQRGQRETDGGLGNFCVTCHAPMAVRQGATTDGLNLDSVPWTLHGVTCFFCHTVEAVQGVHDNPLLLAGDGVLRGAYRNPIASTPHGAAYSPLHDRDNPASATLCGACHDIVNGHGVALERTFAEWQQGAFGQATSEGGLSCGACHMAQSTALEPITSVAGAPLRRVHAHDFAAIDTRLDGDPDAGGQLQLIAQFLQSTIQGAVCVEQLGADARLRVLLDNVSAGHDFPSGSAEDRRVWVEVIASADGGLLYASGGVDAGDRVTDLVDPSLWLMRDCLVDDAGAPVNMFWDAVEAEGNAMPGQLTFDAGDPRFYDTHLVANFPRGGSFAGVPDQVVVRVHVQPIGLDVLDDLIRTGDLDPSVRDLMGTLDVGLPLVWTPATVNQTLIDSLTGGVFQCASPDGLNVNATTVAAVTQAPLCSPYDGG